VPSADKECLVKPATDWFIGELFVRLKAFTFLSLDRTRVANRFESKGLDTPDSKTPFSFAGYFMFSYIVNITMHDKKTDIWLLVITF